VVPAVHPQVPEYIVREAGDMEFLDAPFVMFSNFCLFLSFIYVGRLGDRTISSMAEFFTNKGVFGCKQKG